MFPEFHEPRPGPAAASRSLLLRIAGGTWRVQGTAGCEVAPCPPVARLPGAPGWLVGLVVHKGEAMPLVDPAVLLGGDPQAGAQARARVLVTRGDGFRLALAADDVDADGGGEVSGELDAGAMTRDLLNR